MAWKNNAEVKKRSGHKSNILSTVTLVSNSLNGEITEFVMETAPRNKTLKQKKIEMPFK